MGCKRLKVQHKRDGDSYDEDDDYTDVDPLSSSVDPMDMSYESPHMHSRSNSSVGLSTMANTPMTTRTNTPAHSAPHTPNNTPPRATRVVKSDIHSSFVDKTKQYETSATSPATNSDTEEGEKTTPLFSNMTLPSIQPLHEVEVQDEDEYLSKEMSSKCDLKEIEINSVKDIKVYEKSDNDVNLNVEDEYEDENESKQTI